MHRRYCRQQVSENRSMAPGLWQVVVSVASSFFGVQSSRVRERDFTRGRPSQFILIAFLMTGMVVLVFLLAVHWVMSLHQL